MDSINVSETMENGIGHALLETSKRATQNINIEGVMKGRKPPGIPHHSFIRPVKKDTGAERGAVNQILVNKKKIVTTDLRDFFLL